MADSKPKNRVSSVRLAVSDVEQLASQLKTLAKTPRTPSTLSGTEVLNHCFDAIEACLKAGYSNDEIAQFLSENGLEISGQSLAYHIRRLKESPTASTTKRRTGKRAPSKQVAS